MYRLVDGNDALPAAMAAGLRGRLLLEHVVKRVARRGAALNVGVDDGRLHQLSADYAVMALPASTMKKVAFVPPLPADQWRAITTLRYVARRADGTEVLRGTCVVYTFIPSDPPD